MPDMWVGFLYGAGTMFAVILALYGVIAAVMDRRERKATDYAKARQDVSQARPRRHSKEASQEGTQRLWPPSVTDSGVNLLADDGGKVRPLQMPRPTRPRTLGDVAGHDDR